MPDDTYHSLLDTLDETGKSIFNEIHETISTRYPEYKPVDVKPTDPSKRDWTLAYRKKPKVGKAVCVLQSIDGKLVLRISFLTAMVREVLYRKNEFSKKIKNTVLRQTVCVVNRSCRCYGGKTPCPYRQYFWVDGRQIMACPYPWITFNDLSVDDVADIRLLIDMQTHHMAQDPIEVKGGAYAEVNKQRCGEVEVVNLDTHNFGPQIPDSARTSARLERYAKRYHLIPLGENNGVWFYRSEWATNQYSVYDSSLEVPQGKFASITISDPMTFSVNRGWNYICQWLTERRIKIKEFPLNGENVVLLLTLCQEDGTECTKMYVPIS